MEKYIAIAERLGALNALLISTKDIFFDRRAVLKCRWGCEFNRNSGAAKCGTRGLSFEEGKKAVQSYKHSLLLHTHDGVKLSRLALEMERRLFCDGHYMAFTLRACHICPECRVENGKPCPMPEKVRPCETAFGIDVFRTVRNQGLPCDVLLDKMDIQNRYGFVLID